MNTLHHYTCQMQTWWNLDCNGFLSCIASLSGILTAWCSPN